MDIAIEITGAGGVRMLHDDAVDLSVLGAVEIQRASHVEFRGSRERCFCSGGCSAWHPELGVPRTTRIGWYVQSAKTGKVLADGFQTRAEALAWEKQFYSPSGRGWTELTEGA